MASIRNPGDQETVQGNHVSLQLTGENLHGPVVNLLAEPSFEHGGPAGVVCEGGKGGVTTEAARTGTHSYRIEKTESAGNCGLYSNLESAWAAVTAGRSYCLGGYLLAAATGREWELIAQYFNAKRELLREKGVSGNDATGGWSRLATTATAPQGAAWVRWVVKVDGLAVGEVHYLDDLQVTEVATEDLEITNYVPNPLVTTSSHWIAWAGNAGGKVITSAYNTSENYYETAGTASTVDGSAGIVVGSAFAADTMTVTPGETIHAGAQVTVLQGSAKGLKIVARYTTASGALVRETDFQAIVNAENNHVYILTGSLVVPAGCEATQLFIKINVGDGEEYKLRATRAFLSKAVNGFTYGNEVGYCWRGAAGESPTVIAPEAPGYADGDQSGCEWGGESGESISYRQPVWSAEGLPPGLTISQSGLITGIPMEGAATFQVSVSAGSGNNAANTVFDWLIKGLSAAINRAKGIVEYLKVGDATSDSLLDALIEALLTPADRLSLVAHGDGTSIQPIQALTDPGVAPLWALPHASQWTGGKMPPRLPGEDDSEYLTRARAAVVEPYGMRRGAPGGLVIAAQAHLSGTKTVVAVPFLEGNPRRVELLVRASEIEDEDALVASVNHPEVVTAGMKVEIGTLEGVWDIATLEAVYHGRTISEFETDFTTIAEIEEHEVS